MFNKTEIIEQIAKNHEVTKAKAAAIVNDVFNIISDEVANGNKVCVTGFGTFAPAERNAKTVRNPQTGKMMNVAAKTVPVFRAGSEFKKKVNK